MNSTGQTLTFLANEKGAERPSNLLKDKAKAWAFPGQEIKSPDLIPD